MVISLASGGRMEINMGEKIKLGIIGIGNMGSGHAGNIRDGKCPEIEIAAIADWNAERLNWAKAQGYGGGVSYYSDAMKMLDKAGLDACLVAVPHYDHPRFVIACMQRGIHVMSEKPAGVHTKQVREMRERHGAGLRLTGRTPPRAERSCSPMWSGGWCRPRSF